MRKFILIYIIMANVPFFSWAQDLESHQQKFQEVDVLTNWELKLDDTGTDDWHDHWFLDGEKASIENSEDGMHLQAGPEQGNDAHHAVLWTKKSFEGPIKITYEYTKTDTLDRNVNILYIQATGINVGPYSRDIFGWKGLRTIPKMSSYFNNMNVFHISYAAISNTEGYHYVRARRYPVSAEGSFKETLMVPAYDEEIGTIKNGVTYQISAIKTNDTLLFKVDDGAKMKIFSWQISSGQIITEGRVGFRNMFGRSSIYKNIKVYTQVDPSRPER